MRMSSNGRAPASQAGDAGSIPVIRSTTASEKKKACLKARLSYIRMPGHTIARVCWNGPRRAAAQSQDIAIYTERNMGQKERNKATEVVDGVVETVDVSKHPTASIEPSDLSLADIERRKSHPVRWILFMALVLLAMIAPYWWGRDIAVRDASWMVANLNFLDPKGVALISWTVTIVALTGLGLMVADAKKWLWGTIFVIGLAAEQFVAGMCLLSFNFWNATYVMYGEAAGLANAANLGIIAAGFGVAVYAVLWVGLLVCIKKESKLNVLTRSWASFLLFFAIELVALAVVLFGGLLASMA